MVHSYYEWFLGIQQKPGAIVHERYNSVVHWGYSSDQNSLYPHRALILVGEPGKKKQRTWGRDGSCRGLEITVRTSLGATGSLWSLLNRRVIPHKWHSSCYTDYMGARVETERPVGRMWRKMAGWTGWHWGKVSKFWICFSGRTHGIYQWIDCEVWEKEEARTALRILAWATGRISSSKYGSQIVTWTGRWIWGWSPGKGQD